jgi:hypothetical protein
MACHQAVKKDSAAIRQLSALPRDARPFARKAALPDFVFFSHGRHALAKISCSSCHGAGREAGEPELHAKMKFCVDCHKEKRASIACNLCHELSQ